MVLLDFLEIEEPCPDCRGRSLLPLLRSSSENSLESTTSVESIRMELPWYFKPWEESKGSVNVALRKGKWKGIWNADLEHLELYDLEQDRAELSDVRSEHPQLANELSNKASEWLEACQNRPSKPVETIGIDEKTQEQLRALGYFN